MLSSGCFWWLINIHPGYLVYHQGMTCHMESYLLGRFARQFGSSQLYVGSLNQKLGFQGNLFERACTWYHFCAGGTSARFILPHEMSSLYLSQSLCTWDHVANAITSFRINHDCIKRLKLSIPRKKCAKDSS